MSSGVLIPHWQLKIKNKYKIYSEHLIFIITIGLIRNQQHFKYY